MQATLEEAETIEIYLLHFSLNVLRGLGTQMELYCLCIAHKPDPIPASGDCSIILTVLHSF